MDASAGNSFILSALVESAFPLLDRMMEFEGSCMSYNLNSAGEEEHSQREFVASYKQGTTDFKRSYSNPMRSVEVSICHILRT